jgi:hypothetical protein
MKHYFSFFIITAVLFSSVIYPQDVRRENRKKLFSKPLYQQGELLEQLKKNDLQNQLSFQNDALSMFQNVNLSGNTLPQNEPSVKINRKNPNYVVAAWRDFRTGVNPA